jgi:hypothetical protein
MTDAAVVRGGLLDKVVCPTGRIRTKSASFASHSGAIVVVVIEDKGEAGGARCIEFKVHRSPGDPSRILGNWRLVHGDTTLVDQSRQDAAVAAEFRVVLDCADQHGIPFVWVNDPEELFPPWERR